MILELVDRAVAAPNSTPNLSRGPYNRRSWSDSRHSRSDSRRSMCDFDDFSKNFWICFSPAVVQVYTQDSFLFKGYSDVQTNQIWFSIGFRWLFQLIYENNESFWNAFSGLFLQSTASTRRVLPWKTVQFALISISIATNLVIPAAMHSDLSCVGTGRLISLLSCQTWKANSRKQHRDTKCQCK